MTVLSTTITVTASRLSDLHRALEEAAAEAMAPYYPYEETSDLLDHLRLVWEWAAQLEGGRLHRFLPDRDYVDIRAMEHMFRIFAPFVEVRPDLPCHFAFRDDHTGEAFRYLLIAGEAGNPESARVVMQRGELHWSTPGAFAPRRPQERVLADLCAEIGHTAHPLASEAGQLLALGLEQARRFEDDYWEANRRADHEDAGRVDTQYMEDELVYPLKQAAKLRRLALELLLEHQACLADWYSPSLGVAARKPKQAMKPLQEQRLALAKRLIERLYQEPSTLPLFDEESQLLLSALDLLIQEQNRSYTVLIPLRIPATSRATPSEKRYVTRFLRRWNQYWQASQAGEAGYELELLQEERDEDAGGVFFELTFSVGRKLSAQEKRWLEEQPGVVTAQDVRDAEEDFPAAPTSEGADG